MRKKTTEEIKKDLEWWEIVLKVQIECYDDLKAGRQDYVDPGWEKSNAYVRKKIKMCKRLLYVR